nr:hypothetical protein CTI12_AA326940 [Tanacetum cinerariifolium]
MIFVRSSLLFMVAKEGNIFAIMAHIKAMLPILVAWSTIPDIGLLRSMGSFIATAITVREAEFRANTRARTENPKRPIIKDMQYCDVELPDRGGRKLQQTYAMDLASFVCILAMVANLVDGLRNRLLWFLCKNFTLNSASLTVIAIAMKLPMDLSNPMPGIVDQATKIGSMAFMCAMMANILPSLATMNIKELLTNIIALDILLITLIVNVCIQIYTGMIGDSAIITALAKGIYLFYVSMLLILLIIHTCSGLTILKSKQIIESKYQTGHETAVKDLELQHVGNNLDLGSK